MVSAVTIVYAVFLVATIIIIITIIIIMILSYSGSEIQIVYMQRIAFQIIVVLTFSFT